LQPGPAHILMAARNVASCNTTKASPHVRRSEGPASCENLRTARHTGFLRRFNFHTYDTRFRGKVNRYGHEIWCFSIFVPFSIETRNRDKSRRLGDLGTSQAEKGQRGRSSPRIREGRKEGGKEFTTQSTRRKEKRRKGERKERRDLDAEIHFARVAPPREGIGAPHKRPRDAGRLCCG
jgi:hypothetical protein